MRYADDVNFREGVRLFNEGKYFEAHEAWELLWRKTGKEEQDRREIQGLIQLAAAGHHLVEGKIKGAQGCLENSKKHLGSSLSKLFEAVEQAVENGKPDLLPKIVPLQSKPTN